MGQLGSQDPYPAPGNEVFSMPTADDHQLATRLAVDAGALLLEVRRSAAVPSDAVADTYRTLDIPEEERRSLGAEGDRRAHELLMARLRQERPDDAVLSEEGVQPG